MEDWKAILFSIHSRCPWVSHPQTGALHLTFVFLTRRLDQNLKSKCLPYFPFGKNLSCKLLVLSIPLGIYLKWEPIHTAVMLKISSPSAISYFSTIWQIDFFFTTAQVFPEEQQTNTNNVSRIRIRESNLITEIASFYHKWHHRSSVTTCSTCTFDGKNPILFTSIPYIMFTGIPRCNKNICRYTLSEYQAICVWVSWQLKCVIAPAVQRFTVYKQNNANLWRNSITKTR